MALLNKALIGAAKYSWRLYKHLAFHAEVDVGGKVFRVPVRRGIGLNNLSFIEPQTQAALKDIYTSRQGAFIDVGANVGKILLNVIYFDSEIPYVGFEPNLSCCGYVEELIAANRLRRHSIVPIGLSDRREVATLRLNGDYDVSASTIAEFRGSSTYSLEKPVCLGVGDEVIPELCKGPIACIKIDVEGAEAKVLAGLTGVIREHRPVMMIEVLPYAHIESGDYDRGYFGHLSEEEIRGIVAYRKNTARQIEAFLSERGYRFALIREDASIADVASLDQGDRRNFKEINFLAYPR